MKYTKSVFALLSSTLWLSAQVNSNYPVMRLTEKQALEHQTALKNIPIYKFSTQTSGISAKSVFPSSLNLINTLNIPINYSSWNQGAYPSCWVWGSTLACSVSASTTFTNKALLKTNLMRALSGGDTSLFISKMNSIHYFDDFNYIGETVPAHRFSFTSINSQQIPHDSSAISSIKSILNENKAVIFTYNFPSGHESDLGSVWSSSPESNVWTGIINQGDRYSLTGHVMCIVGYDDTDSSWIVQNSWGTNYNRPNGVLKIPQNLDYGTWLYYNSSTIGHLFGGIYKYEMLVVSPNWVTSDNQLPIFSMSGREDDYIHVESSRDAYGRYVYIISANASDNYGISEIRLEIDGSDVGPFSTIVNGGVSSKIMQNASSSGTGQSVSLPASVYAYDYFGNKSLTYSTILTFSRGEPIY